MDVEVYWGRGGQEYLRERRVNFRAVSTEVRGFNNNKTLSNTVVALL